MLMDANPSNSAIERKPFMLERIIEASARNVFLVVVLAIFGVVGGFWALTRTPLDAIPDLSDVQVIVYTDWEGRSPDLVEDQITYPITTKFIAAPKVKFVRGESMFGKSFVYVIFEDGTDIYWARSRVIEYLNSIRGSLPEGVNPVIGPDATGVGCATPLNRSRGWPKWRRSGALSKNTKSIWTPTNWPPTAFRSAKWLIKFELPMAT
jgi:Cu(I)/Ag(I) efflux system membrane protein CusA/SilA